MYPARSLEVAAFVAVNLDHHGIAFYVSLSHPGRCRIIRANRQLLTAILDLAGGHLQVSDKRLYRESTGVGVSEVGNGSAQHAVFGKLPCRSRCKKENDNEKGRGPPRPFLLSAVE